MRFNHLTFVETSILIRNYDATYATGSDRNSIFEGTRRYESSRRNTHVVRCINRLSVGFDTANWLCPFPFFSAYKPPRSVCYALEMGLFLAITQSQPTNENSIFEFRYVYPNRFSDCSYVYGSTVYMVIPKVVSGKKISSTRTLHDRTFSRTSTTIHR